MLAAANLKAAIIPIWPIAENMAKHDKYGSWDWVIGLEKKNNRGRRKKDEQREV